MEGGRGSIHYVDDHINWGEGNIDENPCFVDAGNGDHRLTEASPCIDAGDPNLPPDPDGTRADMGALYFSQFFAILAGRVFDAVTDEPFINLRIPSQLGIVAVTDSLGEWWMQLPVSANGTQMELRLGARGYVPVVVDTTAFPNDSLWFDIGLDPINLLLNPEEISLVVDSGEMATVEIMLTNPEAIDLEWSAVTYTSGGAGVSLGTLRQTIAAGEITGDNRIQGVAFDGRYFYAAGNGLPGDPTNMVYVIDLEGNFVGSFPQPTSSQYGFKDLEWDGELIWGSGEETVFAINTEGNVVRRWRGPYSLNANIAFDPTIETLWISGTTTDVAAYDRNGNNLGVRLNNRGLRLYGLEWVGSDPDSLPLYLIDVSYESGMTVKKISSDPQIHRIETVFQFQDGAATGRSGLFICQNFDQYGCQVLMDVANISEANGNDMLEIWQIRPNHEWLTISPDHGELVASQQVVLSLELRTMGLNNNWTFASGVYEGEIVFEVPQNGVIAIVPVHLEVVGPNSYEESEHSLLTSFRLEEPFPNPFNSLTTIRFSGSINRKATLRVFDLSGRLVTDLTSQLALVRNEESKQSLVWIAEGLPGGIYLIRLQSEKESRTIKAVLMK